MRRTAALLTLPLFLAVALGEEYEPASSGDGWKARASGERVDSTYLRTRHAMDLLPMLLIAAACVGRPHSAQPLLQAVGSLWLLSLWGRLLWNSPSAVALILSALPFLGMTLLSLLESLVFPRFPPSPDPQRRLTMAVLATLAAGEITKAMVLGGELLAWPHAWLLLKERILWFATCIGTAAAFILSAWGLWKWTRWASWVGCIATTLLFGGTLWEFGRVFVLRPEFRGGTLWFYSIDHFPTHLLQATAAVLLGIRICRDWRSPRHEGAAKG